jgi:signal transduction histidine kinase
MLLPRTICWQIIAFTALSLVLGNAITFAILSYQFRSEQRLHQEETVAAIITTFAGLLAPAETPSEFSKLVAQGRAIGIAVQEVPKAQLAAQRIEQGEYQGFARALTEMSAGERGFTVLSQQDRRAPDGSSLLVRLSNDRILSFTLPSDTDRPPVFGGATLLTASIGVVFVLVLSTYVLWAITSPLSLFATAAEEFGRSLKDGEPLREKGPREIAKMAHVLNTMRSRIVSLIEERTSMLVAIGHDLRTPLTRIVLQAERLPQSSTRRSMLSDLTSISDLLSNMLSYLRGEETSEVRQEVDLPSLVQTVCSEFADRGHPIAYAGCYHLVYSCRPNSLTRALGSVVETCIGHNRDYAVALEVLPSGTVCIDICPQGTRAAFLQRDIEPMSECSLGLSLARTIIESHGGSIELCTISPQSLCASIVLPADPPRRAA